MKPHVCHCTPTTNYKYPHRLGYITLTHCNPYSLCKIFISLRYSTMSRQPQGKSLSQPTSRVGNLERRRCDAKHGQRGFESGTQWTESGSSQSTRTLPVKSSSSQGTQSSGHSSSPPQTTRRPTSRPVNPARRRTLQTTAYGEPEGEPDGQPQIVTVRLRDESRDEYQNSRRSDETESDTEPDAEDNEVPDDDTGSGSRHRSRTADRRQANTLVSAVRVSTTSGSPGAGPHVGRTQAARPRILQCCAYTPPAFTSSSVPPYSSPLATHSPTTSGVRSSSPPSHPNNQKHQHTIRPDSNSRRNTATGAEAAVIVRAKTLMLWDTLFVNPLPAPAILMSEVHRVWLKALEAISDSGNIEPSVASIKIVSGG